MAEKILKGINFPGLEDTYLIPEVDSTLSKSGQAADAKVVGEALAGKQPIGNYIKTINGEAPDENGNIEVVGGGGGEGSGVQSDWNVTDETSAAYIKNKPFYSNFAVTPLLENATVTFQKIPVTTDSKNLYAGGTESSKDTVSLWNEGFTSATVIWDGVTYECTPFSADGMTFIGNEYILTGVDAGGEPFALGFISKAGSYSVEMYSFEIIPSDGSELADTIEHTVSVSINKYEIVKIPADYLYQPDWNTTDETDPAYIKNKPFGEESGIIKYLDNKYISFVESTGLDFISKDDYELIWDSEVPGWTTSSPWIITLNQFEELNKLYLENKTLCVNIDGAIFNSPLTPMSSEPPYLGFSLGDPLFENYPFWILTGLNTDMPENTYTMAIFIPNTDHDTESGINKNIHIYIDGKERINPEYLYKSDWNVTDENDPAYIKNKPFGETVEIIERIDWDGNTEGLTSVAEAYYKVSDGIFTDEQIKTCTIQFDDSSMVVSQEWPAIETMGWVTEDAVFLDAAIFIRRPTVLFDVTFNEPGVYFVNDSDGYVTSVTFSEPVEINTVKTLDNKYLDFIESSSSKIKKEYLPDDIGGSINPDTLKFKSIILESSTEGSSKCFKITIDDTGTLSVEELGG